MDVEANTAFASRNIEIEATIAEVQVPGRAEGIVDRAQTLPVGMGADDPKAAVSPYSFTPIPCRN
jgi:hypothetical protein